MMIKFLLFQPLGPALVLALGASLLALGRWITSRRMAREGIFRHLPELVGKDDSLSTQLRLPFALLILLAAGVVLFAFRGSASRPALQWTWQPLTVAGSLLDWQMDSWNWLAALLIMLVTTTALLLDDELPPLRQAGVRGPVLAPWQRLDRSGAGKERTLWLAAAALVFVTSGNVLTLASSWILLDAALAWRLRPGMHVEPAGRTWGLLSLTGVLLLLVLTLLGEGGIRAELSGTRLDGWELGLLWFAALIRAGVYPLHFWLTSPGHSSRRERMALCVVAPLAGLWLMGRLHDAAAAPDWLRRPEWAALGAFALFGTALGAWAEIDEAWRWRWIALNRAGLVVLAAYMAGSSGPEALTWAVLTFGLGCTLLAVGQAARESLGWRAPAWLAALTLWGLPGTPGFLARSALVYPTELPVAIPFFGLIVLSETLLVAALWQAANVDLRPTFDKKKGFAHRRPERQSTSLRPSPEHPRIGARPSAFDWRTTVSLGLAVVLLAVPLVAWGLAPQRLAALAGWPVSDVFPALRLALEGARKSVWAGLGLSAMLGIVLGLLRTRIFGHMTGWQRGIAAIVSLEWLYQAAAFGFALFAAGLQYFARLGEGEGYLGWLALAGLILWVLLRG